MRKLDRGQYKVHLKHPSSRFYYWFSIREGVADERIFKPIYDRQQYIQKNRLVRKFGKTKKPINL